MILVHIGIMQQAYFNIYITLYHKQILVLLGNIPIRDTVLDQNEIHIFLFLEFFHCIYNPKFH